jgi:tetratricopeptide (TPR) repeat protein
MNHSAHLLVAERTALPPAPPPQLVPLLGQAARLLQAGRAGDAVVPLREAARCMPGNAGIWHDLGLACLESGQIAAAITALRSSVAIDPRFQDSYLRLGIALETSGALEEALGAYDQAARLQPLAEASYRAAHVLESLGDTPRAIELFRRAAAAGAGSTAGRLAMARALLAEDRDAEAEKLLRKVLSTEPDNAVALDLLANTLADAGRFAQARRYFTRAIDVSENFAGRYYDIARCGRVGPGDAALLARMRAALQSQRLDPAQRVRVHLALGKAADDLGRYEEAMREFDAAEAVRNQIVRFDLGKFEQRVDGLIAHFTPERLARVTAEVHDPARRSDAQRGDARRSDARPIFIFGMPRSGTTLLEQILSCHPDVRAGGELPFWNERGSAWERVDSEEARAGQLASSAADYQRLLNGLRSGGTHVTDKNPLNFQWAGLVYAALPHAILIHCRRDPLDTALSIHQTHFNPRMSFPTGGEALVGYIRAYQRLCAHWRAVLPPERFIEIDYEDLVADPDEVIRGLVAASGLEWNPACLHPERNARAVKTPSKWQARQPIYRHAHGRWRAYEPWLGKLSRLKN